MTEARPRSRCCTSPAIPTKRSCTTACWTRAWHFSEAVRPGHAGAQGARGTSTAPPDPARALRAAPSASQRDGPGHQHRAEHDHRETAQPRVVFRNASEGVAGNKQQRMAMPFEKRMARSTECMKMRGSTPGRWSRTPRRTLQAHPATRPFPALAATAARALAAISGARPRTRRGPARPPPSAAACRQ